MANGILMCVFLSRYGFTALAVCLQSLSNLKLKLLPIRRFPDGITWWIRSLLDFFPFLKDVTYRYCSSAVNIFFKVCHFFFCAPVSSDSLKDTL